MLSVPAVVLSGLFELRKVGSDGGRRRGGPRCSRTVVAFVVGYAAIAWFLRYLVNHGLTVFVVYRLIVGVVLIGLLASGAPRSHLSSIRWLSAELSGSERAYSQPRRLKKVQ